METRAFGKEHLLTSRVWRGEDRSSTLFWAAYVCSSHLFVLRQLGICRPLCRGSSSPGDLQYPGYYLKVDRDMIRFTYPSLSKGLLMVGSMVRFPIRKRLLRRASASQRCINP